MALLNPPEILPPLIRSVVEVVAASDRPVGADQLIDMMSPGLEHQTGRIGRDRGKENPDKPHVRASLEAARQLGFLDREGQGFRPSATMAELRFGRVLPRSSWIGHMRTGILQHPSANNAVTEAFDGDTSGSRDLLFALTWFLSQDAFGPPLAWEPRERYGSFLTLQRSHFGAVTKRYPVQNDTRFGAFERWSLHLGFARQDELGTRALRPAPIPAARDVVKSMEPRRYEIGSFCSLLSEHLPILWPGYLREQLVELVGFDPDPDVAANGLDSSVALVLVTLEAEGLLLMENLADASERRTLAPRSRQSRSVTHVEVMA